jgi:hypothetical protein
LLLLDSVPDDNRPVKITDIVPGATLQRCATLIAIACVCGGLLTYFRFQQLFVEDAGGISALLQIFGTLYSVLYAFATYVIWGQFTAVESEILKESGALKDIIIFSRRLKENDREPIVRAVKNYARTLVETEWQALSRGAPTEKTDKLFFDIVAVVTAVKFEDDAERSIFERLLEITNEASAHRDERLSLSVKRMPRTLLAFVVLTAMAILFLLFFYPFRNAFLGIVSIAVTTMLLYFAHFVVTDLDNPFEGTWNLDSAPFRELITKFR